MKTSLRQSLIGLWLALTSSTGAEFSAEVSPPAEPMSVWFASPARSFHESCPLGNGRLGAMDFGGVGRERIVLNESSLWSGGPYDGNNYDAYQCLPEVREKLFAGDISGASRVLGQSFRYANGVRGWGDINQFGCYQALGNLLIEFEDSAEASLSSPSGHGPGDGKTVEHTTDGNPGSKWCVNTPRASRPPAPGSPQPASTPTSASWNGRRILRRPKSTTATVRSLAGNPGRLRYGKVTRELALKQGETATWDGRP